MGDYIKGGFDRGVLPEGNSRVKDVIIINTFARLAVLFRRSG